MPFIELHLNEDDEPGPRPRARGSENAKKHENKLELSREERWAAELESTSRQRFFGRAGELVDRALSIKGRYIAIAALAIAGGTAVYVDHVISQSPAPVPNRDPSHQPDSCAANLPPGLASEDPAQAIAIVKRCRDDNAWGGLLKPNPGSPENEATSLPPAGPQN